MKWIALSVAVALLAVLGGLAAYELGQSRGNAAASTVTVTTVPVEQAPPPAYTGTRPLTVRVAALHIEKLSGAVVNLGSWSGYGLLGVRLRARVCVRGATTALYPDAITVTHYQVVRSRRVWWPRRTTVDRPAWLVPLGETWKGAGCGPVIVEDAIPPIHYDAVSLGNPLSCYGVVLTLKFDGLEARKRAIIQCGGIHATERTP